MTNAQAILAMLDGTVADNKRRQLIALRELCLGPPGAKHVSGGAQLAAIVKMLEAHCDRPLIEISVQFRGSPALGTEFDIAMPWLNNGRSITQAEAHILQDDRITASAHATLGTRPDLGEFQWVSAPYVPLPDPSPPMPFIRMDEGDLHSHLGFRIASDPATDRNGRLCFWVPWSSQEVVSSALLALIGDYLPEAVHFNIGRPAGAVSLDNKLRIIRRTETKWLLCEVQLSAVHAGLFHGQMLMYDEQQRLLAVASQSGIVRPI
jgi:acyl-CoA thioesterase II